MKEFLTNLYGFQGDAYDFGRYAESHNFCLCLANNRFFFQVDKRTCMMFYFLFSGSE